jgi:hypothetical protein
MSDFFGALELELRAAAERRPRRPVGVGQALGAVAVLVLLATAVGVAMTVAGGGDNQPAHLAGARQPDPVGTVIPKGEGKPPRQARTLVVASGVAPVSGPWQIEVNRTKGERDTNGEVMWHRGYCMSIVLLDPPDRKLITSSGFCGSPRSLGFRKTPGFSRSQTVGPHKPLPREILVWGRVPDRAEKVVIRAPGIIRIVSTPTDGPESFPGRFYAIPVRPLKKGMPGARVNWLDADGKPGSRGIRLMPPLSRPIGRG